MQARVTRVQLEGPFDDERIADAVSLLPAVRAMDGHQGSLWLLDRATGAALALDLYRDSEHIDSTSQGDLRDEIIQRIGGRLIGVEVYEVIEMAGIRAG